MDGEEQFRKEILLCKKDNSWKENLMDTSESIDLFKLIIEKVYFLVTIINMIEVTMRKNIIMAKMLELFPNMLIMIHIFET